METGVFESHLAGVRCHSSTDEGKTLACTCLMPLAAILCLHFTSIGLCTIIVITTIHRGYPPVTCGFRLHRYRGRKRTRDVWKHRPGRTRKAEVSV